MHPQIVTRNHWLAQRNLAFNLQEGSCLPQETITYCLVSFVLRPSEVPVEVVEELVRAGYIQSVDDC